MEMDIPARLAAGVVAAKLGGAEAVHNAFRDDRSRRVSGAEKKDVQRRVTAYDGGFSSSRRENSRPRRPRSEARKARPSRHNNPPPGRIAGRGSPQDRRNR